MMEELQGSTLGGVPQQVRAASLGLVRFDSPWWALGGEVRAALGELVAEPYLRLSYPTDAAFTVACGHAPGSPAFAAAWAAAVARSRETQLATYGQDDWVCGIGARRADGTLVALGTMLTARGVRDIPWSAAIGDVGSRLPTLRMLRFGTGPHDGIPADLPERALGEFARICIRQRPELAALVAEGTLSTAAATEVEGRGFDELFARSYRRDRALPDPPRAYVGNAKPRMMAVLAARGVDVRPLYLADGAEATPRILGGGEVVGAYFAQWTTALAPLVSPAILAAGPRAALRELARSGFTAWETLPLSLPHLILANARTGAALGES